MPHKFSIGQGVKLADHSVYRVGSDGSYAIVRQLPYEDFREPTYRIKAVGEPYDRVMRESELVVAGALH